MTQCKGLPKSVFFVGDSLTPWRDTRASPEVKFSCFFRNFLPSFPTVAQTKRNDSQKNHTNFPTPRPLSCLRSCGFFFGDFWCCSPGGRKNTQKWGHNLQIIKTKLIQTDDLPQDPRLTRHGTTVEGEQIQLTSWGWQLISLFTRFYTSRVGFCLRASPGSSCLWENVEKVFIGILGPGDHQKFPWISIRNFLWTLQAACLFFLDVRTSFPMHVFSMEFYWHFVSWVNWKSGCQDDHLAETSTN